jgi:hypothetical protein
MKQLLTFCLVAFGLSSGIAQQGFSIGANFMPMSSNIVNQNTWGNGREYDYVGSLRTSYGIDVGYGFSEQLGIYSGYWFTDLGQDYEDSYSGSEWERSLTFKYNVIPVMLKFNGSGSKVNILAGAGVLLASLKEAQQEWLRDGNPYSEVINNPITGDNFDLGEEDVTERYVESDILINLELGARFLFSEKLFLDASLNFGYGLKDINHEDWQIPNGEGIYDPSHNAYVGLRLGLAYVLFGGTD